MVLKASVLGLRSAVGEGEAVNCTEIIQSHTALIRQPHGACAPPLGWRARPGLPQR